MPRRFSFSWARVILAYAFAYAFACGIAGTFVSACADQITPGTVRVPNEDVLWRLRVAPRGITMAVGQNLTLTTTVLNILGEPITLPDSVGVKFQSLDSSRVIVTPEGVVNSFRATAIVPGMGQIEPVQVIASLRFGTVVKADTIYIAVTDTAPTNPPASVSLIPAIPYPGDSSWAAYTEKMIPITMLTTTGDTIPDPFLFLHTGQWRKGLKEQLTPGNRFMLFFRTPGRFWVYATGWVYGVEFQDSVEYIQTDLPFAVLTFTPNPGNPNEANPLQYSDNAAVVSPCGIIMITNEFLVPVDMIFTDANATSVCTPDDETGNVIALQPNQTAIRKIRNAGTYQWSVTRTGGPPFTKPFTGSIRVRAHTEF